MTGRTWHVARGKSDAATTFRRGRVSCEVPSLLNAGYGRDAPTSASCDVSSQLIVPPPIAAGIFISLFTM